MSLGFSGDNEPVPDGYNEALKDCNVLAVNLLSLAVSGEYANRCYDCISWVGRCVKDHVWRIAMDVACCEFTSKKRKGENNAGN